MNEFPEHDNRERTPVLTRLVALFMRGDVAVSLMLLSVAVGAMALMLTPREEDPQITVPMADLVVQAPGLDPEEIERQITSKLERIIFQVQGVEHVYSRSLPEQSITTVRFFVGQDRERALVRLQNEIDFFRDEIPPQVKDWVVKPQDIQTIQRGQASLMSSFGKRTCFPPQGRIVDLRLR